MKRFAWTLVIVAFVACGRSRRTVEHDGDAGAPTGGTSAGNAGSATGGTATGGIASGGSATGGVPSGGTGASVDECVVVRRVDCCIEPFVVHSWELEADECLVPWDHLDMGRTVERDERCAATRPSGCSPEPCTQPGPPSRVAAMDEEARCFFTNECATVNDCVFAAQACNCCPCPRPTPAKLVADACIFGEGEPLPDPNPEVFCPSGFCLGCRHEREMSCSATPRGVRRCEWGPELPEDACTSERPCPRESGVTCNEPGNPVCGGPPPPPDECATDSDCDSAGQTQICVPTGHCGQRVCEPGCTSDSDCGVPEVCGSDHRCAPRPCSDSGTCGPNFACNGDGLCERRSCAFTENCEGHCVNGRCYAEPGTCVEPLP